MKILLRSVLLVCLMVASVSSFAYQPPLIRKQINDLFGARLNREVKMDRVAVKFKPNTPWAVMQACLEKEGMTMLFQVPWPQIAYVQLNSPDTSYLQLTDRLMRLEQDNNVDFASPIMETIDKSGYTILNEGFVKLKPGVALNKLMELGTTIDFTVKEKYQHLDNVYVITYHSIQKEHRGGIRSTQNILESCITLKLLKDFVEYAEPDYLLNPLVCTNDALYSRQWPIHNDSTTTFTSSIHGTIGASMHVDSAWTITQGDSNIHIAVIDAGVDTLHPDLVGNILPGYDATGQGSHGYPNTNKRENGHGTSCTGIIVAKGDDTIGTVGVAPHCKVLPIRVFYYIDSLGQTNIPWSTSAWMANAIGYAWHTGNVDVMSNSWAVPDLLFSLIGDSNSINLVTDLIGQASVQGRNGKGIPMFFSSGNWDSSQISFAPVPLWPSRLHSAIAVNATSMCDEAKTYSSCDHEQWVGHHGDNLKISAPGVQVPTCDMTGNLGYNNTNYTTTFNGTSAACPNAAAVMALILSVRPDLTWGDAIKVLYQSADTVGGYNYDTIKEYGHWSNQLGYGRVNAFKALTMAQSYVGVEETPQPEINGLTVYPNPVQDMLNISYSISSSRYGVGCNECQVSFNVFSSDGKLIMKQNIGWFGDGKRTETIHLDPSLANGFYYGKLVQNDGKSTPFRFVIMK